MLHPINWQLEIPYYTAAFVFGYLLGSIPFGLIFTRLAGGGDIRAVGSGNIGATNVLRTGHKGLAAATLLCDILKGTLAVVLTFHFYGQDLSIVASLGAFLGHLFPIWLKFRGGKGVATFFGLLIGFVWPVALAFAAIWLVVAAIARYASLASLIACASTPLLLWQLAYRQEAQLFALLAALVWIMHGANIKRLIGGSEGRIGK